VGEECRREDV